MVPLSLLNSTHNAINTLVTNNGLTLNSTATLGDILVFLRDDIAFYIANRNMFTNAYKHAWEEAIKRRLKYFPQPVLVALGIPLNTFDALILSWQSQATPTALPLKFGQMRIGPNFAGPVAAQPPRIQQAAAQAIAGIPAIALGAQVGNNPLAYGHAFPIHIFYHAGNWIAANNRGLAAHCLAGIQPRRLIPRLPQQLELNRLNEVEGVNQIGPLIFTPAFARPPFLPNPRTLPSDAIPITNGPNTWTVINAARIPLAWI
jgi:hypothetical protein